MSVSSRAALDAAIGVDEFILSEGRSISIRRSSGQTKSISKKVRLESHALIYSDSRLGRGQSTLTLTDGVAIESQILVATRRAQSALGPAWRLQPPAAPAKVRINDKPMLRDSGVILDQIEAELRQQLPKRLKILTSELNISRDEKRVQSSNGFDNTKRSVLLTVSLLLQADGGEPVRFRSRTHTLNFDWPTIFATKARQSIEKKSARFLEPTGCDLVLLGDAYLPTKDDDFGIWTALASQCSAQRARSGMARYRVGQRITENAAEGEALTLSSDGTLDYGLRTAPFGDFGQVVRRFPVVTNLMASGQAMEIRDAAIARGVVNGSVRNLVIGPGHESHDTLLRPEGRPLLIAHTIHQIHANPRGLVSIHILNGELRRQQATGQILTSPVRSCVVSGDIYQWLQNAYYSKQTADYHWHHGPTAIRFNTLRVL